MLLSREATRGERVQLSSGMKPIFILAVIIGSYLGLSDAKSFWSKSPAGYGPDDSDNYVLKTGYPVGNGKLGG